MRKTIVVRDAADRLRYSILFELLLLVILTSVGALVLKRQILDVGLLTVMLAAKAMLFNLAYNWLFDRMDVRAGRVPTLRSPFGRIIHAIGFECGLVLTSLPLVIWWLDFTLVQALVMDLAVTSFVVAYTVVFGWGYDRLFPVPQPTVCDSQA